MPSRNSVTCRPSRMTMASLPIRSIRLMWLSRLTRTQGQLRRGAPRSAMGGFAGAGGTGEVNPRVCGEAGGVGGGGCVVEPVIGIDVRDMLIGLRIGRHLHVAVETEELADRHLHVGEAGDLLGCGGHCSSRGLGNDGDPFRSMEWCGFGREFSRKPRVR